MSPSISKFLRQKEKRLWFRHTFKKYTSETAEIGLDLKKPFLKSHLMFKLILLLNAIWFGLGFHLFALRSKIFAKILVPKPHRDTPVFDMLAETGKFLGGFNFAFCLLNVILLFNTDIFPEDNQRVILLLVFAVAHGSQFISNVPIALDNRKGKGVWQVKGLMLFIFITDFILTIANLAIAGTYLW